MIIIGRNKDPEHTMEKILTVSAKLFIEKGYEKTSIQDILDITGISKGGIYHHFKSKEEILDEIMQRRSTHMMEYLNDLIQITTAFNTKEKIEKILFILASDTKAHELDVVLSTQIKNPQFIVSGFESTINIDAPIIARLFESGNLDGSLEIDNPLMCAEVFMFLLNFWANPSLFGRDSTETGNRLKYLQKIMRLMGADVVNDSFIEMILKQFERINGINNGGI